jgi:hypothetical protein
MAPPQGGVFDYKHKLLDWFDRLCRKCPDFPAPPAHLRAISNCFVSLGQRGSNRALNFSVTAVTASAGFAVDLTLVHT